MQQIFFALEAEKRIIRIAKGGWVGFQPLAKKHRFKYTLDSGKGKFVLLGRFLFLGGNFKSWRSVISVQ
jgi:hypothetical protein